MVAKSDAKKIAEGAPAPDFTLPNQDGKISRAWAKVKAEGHAEEVLDTVKSLLSA